MNAMFDSIVTACDESAWPDKGLICGECKVLVNNFYDHGTCASYCRSIGRTCVGAWEEQDDDCRVESDMTCDEPRVTFDAICQCSPDGGGDPSGVLFCVRVQGLLSD